MKEGFKIILCGVEMEFRYYSGRNSVFAWYDGKGDRKKEYLYMKPTNEVERELQKIKVKNG